MNKDLLTLLDLQADEILSLLGRAAELKALRVEGRLPKPLASQVWALVFEKASTRTRVSFETGVALLGGSTIFMNPDYGRFGRGESLEDTGRVLSGYVDGLILRTYAHNTQETMARWTTIPVINGLSDLSHPCQVLADLLTIQERRGSLEGLKVAWVGDGNNVAYSWIAAAIRLPLHLTLACPPGYEPKREIMERAERSGASVRLVVDPGQAVAGAEAVSTDVWTSMGQEAEAEERRRAFAGYQVNRELLALAGPGAMVLHCLPAHRGEEISAEVLEGGQSVVFAQAENRLYAQMSVLEAMAGKK